MWPTDIRFPSKSAERRFDALRRLVESLDVLPTTARLPMRILQLHRDPHSTLEQFGEVLSADPALASRVLGLANSAWAAQGSRIVRISDAIRTIGISNLMPLLFGVSLAGLFNRADVAPSQREEIWRTALLKAVVARFAAAKCAPHFAEEAFLCGLMQDIGLPIMLACDKAASVEITAGLSQSITAVLSRERELFGVTHPDVSAALGIRLNLPELFIDSARTHHDTAGPRLPQQFAGMTCALRLAAAIPHRAIPGAPVVGEGFNVALKGINPALAREQPDFVGALTREYQAVLNFLGTTRTDSDQFQFRDFLQDVCQRVAHTLSNAIEASAHTVSELRSRINQLEHEHAQPHIDPLTGVLHRAAIVSRAQDLLHVATERGWHVAVGFSDIDDFRQINQLHGRESGDAVLRAIGRALKDAVGPTGAVGRFGSDEFVFIVFGESQGQLQSASEVALAVLARQTCRVGEKCFPVTFSTGLHTIGVPTRGTRFEDELRKAGSLLTAARKQGKDRCVTNQHNARAA